MARIYSPKEIEKKYLTADSKSKRIGIIIGSFFQSLISIIIAGAISGFSFAIPLLLQKEANENNDSSIGLIIFSNLFLIVGLLILTFEIIRVIKLLQIFKKHPINNFSTKIDEQESISNSILTEKKSTSKITALKSTFVYILGSVFFITGILVIYFGASQYKRNQIAAETYIPVPCEIIFAKLERYSSSSSSSKTGTTYLPKISYKYRFDGKKYTNDRLSIISISTSSSRQKGQELLNKYKSKKECWVNPNAPSEACLLKPEKEFSFSKIIPVLFGIPFALVGLIIIILRLKSTSKKTENKI